MLNLFANPQNSRAPTTSNALSVYAAGTAYSLTNTQAALTFGTTSPSLTITSPGTYLILSAAQLDYNAATFAAVRNATIKLRRTNNTAADVTGATRTLKTGIITLLTYTLDVAYLPPVFYTTQNSNDTLSIFGALDTVATAGTLDAVAASIVAYRLQL